MRQKKKKRSTQVIKSTKKRQRITQLLRDRDGDMCSLCGLRLGFIFMLPDRAPINAWYRSIDHIVPPQLGGAVDDLSNLRLAHKRCNEQRGQRDVSPAQQTDPWLVYNILD